MPSNGLQGKFSSVGVRLINLDEGEKLVSLERIAEAESEGENGEAAEGEENLPENME